MATSLANPNEDPIVKFAATQPQGTISSDTLKPTTTVDYQQPKPTPVYPSANVNASLPPAPLTVTPTEQEISKNLTETKAINDSLIGKTAYQNEQEKAAGLPALLDTQKSISKQILGLQADAKSIPDLMQQQAAGRGITEAGLAPLTTAALRENSIKANILGAQLSASQLDVASANDQVKKAVEMKFGPLEEELKAKTANLELLLKDPNLSLEQTNRATAQLAVEKKKEAQLAKDKADYEAIHKTATDAAANGADAVTLQKISAATTPDEALQIAAKAGFVKKPEAQPASVQEYEYAKKNGYTGSFSDYQNEDANRKRSIAAAGVANDFGLNSKQVPIFNAIVDKYNKSPLVAANDRAVILKDVTSAVEADPTNASLQVSFIYSMIQALDTYQSAVREGEIGLISGTQGLGEKLTNLPDKIAKGTPLSASKVKEYVATAKLLTDSINNAALKKQNTFTAQAKIAGIGAAFDEFTKSTTVQPITPKGSGSTFSSPSGKSYTLPY